MCCEISAATVTNWQDCLQVGIPDLSGMGVACLFKTNKNKKGFKRSSVFDLSVYRRKDGMG